MFTRLLSLWVTGALLLLLNWDTTLGSEDYDEDVTPTPDYDYNNVTFDYYTYNNTLGGEDNDEDVTPTPDYDYNNFTFDYYTYNGTPINYEGYEILKDTKNQGNTDSVSVYIHCGILAGLLVLHFCQQT